jgi:hypothetical protein
VLDIGIQIVDIFGQFFFCGFCGFAGFGMGQVVVKNGPQEGGAKVK